MIADLDHGALPEPVPAHRFVRSKLLRALAKRFVYLRLGRQPLPLQVSRSVAPFGMFVTRRAREAHDVPARRE